GANNEYRSWLLRKWSTSRYALEPYLLWVGMNPSTADANVNDPTISRIIRFTHGFFRNACVICNVMDYRATHPADLCRDGVVPCSDKNLGEIVRSAMNADRTILCYGVVPRSLQKYPDAVVAALRKQGIPLWCLGKTTTGHPRHPLYLRSDTSVEPF